MYSLLLDLEHRLGDPEKFELNEANKMIGTRAVPHLKQLRKDPDAVARAKLRV